MDKQEIAELQTYLRAKFKLPSIKLEQQAKDKDLADVFIGTERVGKLSRIEDDGELSWDFSMNFSGVDNKQTDKILKLQAFMRDRFKLPAIRVEKRPKVTDSVEVYIEDESIGLIYYVEGEGKPHWDFQMSILEIDLEESE